MALAHRVLKSFTMSSNDSFEFPTAASMIRCFSVSVEPIPNSDSLLMSLKSDSLPITNSEQS